MGRASAIPEFHYLVKGAGADLLSFTERPGTLDSLIFTVNSRSIDTRPPESLQVSVFVTHQETLVHIFTEILQVNTCADHVRIDPHVTPQVFPDDQDLPRTHQSEVTVPTSYTLTSSAEQPQVRVIRHTLFTFAATTPSLSGDSADPEDSTLYL